METVVLHGGPGDGETLVIDGPLEFINIPNPPRPVRAVPWTPERRMIRNLRYRRTDVKTKGGHTVYRIDWS